MQLQLPRNMYFRKVLLCVLYPGQRNWVTADEIPFTCVKVPIPKSPTPAPKKCEDLGKPSPLFSHTVFDVVERSAENVAFFVNGTVLDRQKSFCVFGCHSKKSSQNHPEKSSRSSCAHCGCHSYNISCSDWSRSGLCKEPQSWIISPLPPSSFLNIHF